jgi:hypothetical protein
MNTATIERSAAHQGHAIVDQAWSVGRGQQVKLVRPGLRRRTMQATVVSGKLVVGANPRSEFELVIVLPDAADRPITISSATARSLSLVSQGEFHQRGRPPSLWLTVGRNMIFLSRGLTGTWRDRRDRRPEPQSGGNGVRVTGLTRIARRPTRSPRTRPRSRRPRSPRRHRS